MAKHLPNFRNKGNVRHLTTTHQNRNHMQKQCLNCQQLLDSNFCPNCGQDGATHRFSIKHFFIHVFVNGIFQLEKGFFYTVKELFIRPGHSIRKYIQGKRMKHFNYFTFLILVITIGLFF